MRGVAFGRRLAKRHLRPARRRGLHAPTTRPTTATSAIEGQGYAIRGGNHLAGTHVMGTSPSNSVVDAAQRSWDHQNLYLVGGGTMPTIGTSNITLTMAALALKTRGTHDPAAAGRAGPCRPVREQPVTTPTPKITSHDDLITYLKAALRLEHATIPPYLTALYSLHPGSNSPAWHILRVVAVEEMLHLTLVANVMNAVGGVPNLTEPEFVPSYPTALPRRRGRLRRGPAAVLGRQAVDTFLQIERPGKAPEGRRLIKTSRDSKAPELLVADPLGSGLRFCSIGEFYEEIIRGLEFLDQQYQAEGRELFTGNPDHQVRRSTSTPAAAGDPGNRPGLSARGAAASSPSRARAWAAASTTTRRAGPLLPVRQLKLGRYYQEGDSAGRLPAGPGVHVDWDAVYPVNDERQARRLPGGLGAVRRRARVQRGLRRRSSPSSPRHSTASRAAARSRAVDVPAPRRHGTG